MVFLSRLISCCTSTPVLSSCFTFSPCCMSSCPACEPTQAHEVPGNLPPDLELAAGSGNSSLHKDECLATKERFYPNSNGFLGASLCVCVCSMSQGLSCASIRCGRLN